ncbi:MAG: DUF547 domain-containing protein [Desulfobacteraceae bacterium]|nr:DUF547 domain-containing protein [Desulfobacteraceae bacterium]
MKTITIIHVMLGACLAIGSVFPVAAASDTALENTLYARLLTAHVHDGVVNYDGFAADESKLDAYLDFLASRDPDQMPRNEQFAFYINAYNAWTIKLILRKYPDLTSIKDLGSFFSSPWKKKICRINGKMLSLDEIEHDILRPKFQDPRVHFAINCASQSCPKLISEPYEAQILDSQLDAATKAFINNPERNYLSGTTLYVSKIFKWFKEDFNHDILSFFLEYASGELQRSLLANADAVTIKYLDYDWSLNDK